jgi:hypothetical protein
MKHIFEIMLLLLLCISTFMLWGEPIISTNVEAVIAQSKSSEETTETLPEGGTLGKTRITSVAFFEQDQYALSDLSEEGKNILQEFTKKALVAETDYAEQYVGLSIVMTITTTCYNEPPLSTLRAETINAYLKQLLSEYDQADLKLTIKYKVGENAEPTSEEQKASGEGSDAQSELSPHTYSIAAELKVKERGPRVSHPTDIILYEVIEE